MPGSIDVIFSYMQTIQLILLYGWPFIVLFILFILKIKWRKWPVEAIIIELRGNNLIKSNDRTGKYYDAYSGLTGYKLQKNNETMPILNYDWVLHNSPKYTTIFDRFVHLLRGDVGTAFFIKYGAKQYKPIQIKINDKRKLIWKEIKDKNGQPILMQVYEQFDPRKHLGLLDFEVIDWDNMNFMVQEQRASFERRQKKKDFLRQVLIPLAALAIVGLVCVIMIKFSYDYAIGMKSMTPQQEAPATRPDIPIINDLIPAG